MKIFRLLCLAPAFISALLSINEAAACTRVLFTGEADNVITGRSMDWEEDMHSNLWVFPRGMQRSGAAGTRSITWTSKYGSVIISGYDVGTADGMNEKGLVANVLYLAESEYGKPGKDKPLLSISLWAQYVLDNYQTVHEAVEALQAEPFAIIAPTLPNGSPAQLHLSLSDPTGDSAIFEFINGKQVIHHGKQYTVMTNSPSFDQQLALNSYWKSIGGSTFLPGTNRAADRFARAYFFVSSIPKHADPQIISAVTNQEFNFQAVASVLSVMRSVSVPLGMTTESQPNIASTLWRTVADQKNKIYYFDSSTVPNVFWIDFKEVNFDKGAAVKELRIAGGQVYAGSAVKHLIDAKAFTFLPAEENKK